MSELATALRLLEAARRPNAGLVVDVMHHARSGGTPEDLHRLAPDRVDSVQLADGPATAPDDLLDEAMYHRMLPGAGNLRVATSLRVLTDIGVRAAVGLEVFRPGQGCSAREVAAELYAATAAVLDRA